MTPFFTEQVWRTGELVVHVIREEPRQRAIRPLSMNPVDPGATISRTPSGRIVIGPPPNVLVTIPPEGLQSAQARPYALPEFHMIGAPSARHMGAPVRLIHGVKPPETLQTGPKVVWLDEAGRSDDDAGGRIKRLR